VIEPGDLPVALPKLNVVAVDKLLCLFRGVAIIDALEGNRLLKMTV
jgi:hypothetical protein